MEWCPKKRLTQPFPVQSARSYSLLSDGPLQGFAVVTVRLRARVSNNRVRLRLVGLVLGFGLVLAGPQYSSMSL